MSSSLAPELAAKLLLEQYLLVCRSMRPGVFAMPAFCAVLCFIFSEWISFAWLLGWWGAVALVSAGNAALDWWQDRTVLEPSHIGGWIQTRSVVGFAHNVIWTLPAYVFWPFCDDIGQLLLVLIYACSMSGGIALTAPCPRWMLALTLPLVGAITLPPLLQGTWLYWSISFLALGYTAFMGHLAYELFKAARASLLLRQENAGLVVQLSQAKMLSDEARARAEAASRAKSDFLANMSHELRTPLNAVLGFSDMIQKRIWGDDALGRYVEYAESIHTSGRYLLELINDVLDLAKIEAGRFELVEEDIELTEVAREALRLVELQARNKGVRTLIDASARVCVRADERAVRQILANLLSNAVKFTPEGGRVTVSIEHGPEECAAIVVRDSGVGIRPEDLSRVMESFGQGCHDLTPTNERGTGLGLPIVKGLIEAHGGVIRIESELGVGTAVMVTLPADRVVESAGASKVSKIA